MKARLSDRLWKWLNRSKREYRITEEGRLVADVPAMARSEAFKSQLATARRIVEMHKGKP